MHFFILVEQSKTQVMKAIQAIFSAAPCNGLTAYTALRSACPLQKICQTIPNMETPQLAILKRILDQLTQSEILVSDCQALCNLLRGFNKLLLND